MNQGACGSCWAAGGLRDQQLESTVKTYNLNQQLPSLKLTDIAPENGWFDGWKMSFLLGNHYFQLRTVSFREGILLISNF